MFKKSAALRSASAAAILSLSLGLGGPVAFAQQEEPITSAPVITEDAGNLTIHKYANPSTTGTPTGTEEDLPNGETLEGVGFTIYKIDDIDLTTNDGLAAAAGIEASDYVNGTTVTGATQVAEGTTDADGQIVLNDLPIGAYLVVETAPLPGYSSAAPFIAFVPMTEGNAETGGVSWNYDVHAYPKNYNSAAEKEVEDSNMNVGDVVDFTITSDVPALPDESATLSKYVVQDDLQEEFISTTAEQISVTDSNGGTYVAGQDYNATVDAATQEVEVTFTQAGLTRLTEAKRADDAVKVVTTIAATVNAPGKLVNDATVISNNGSGGGDITTDTNETFSYWGNVRINKVDAADGASLAGAVFQLYNPGDDGVCSDADQVEEQRITANGENEWTTGEDGLVTITGLHINDYEDNGAGESDDQAPAYCLFEVESPEGYELMSKPIELVLSRANAEAAPAVYELEAEVENLQDTTPHLPMTGGMGIGLLAALGALLVGAGAWFARRNSKQV